MFAQALNQLMAWLVGKLASRHIEQIAELLAYRVVASRHAIVATARRSYCVVLLISSS